MVDGGNLHLKKTIKVEEDDVQNSWKEYFGDLFNVDIKERDAFNMCGSGGGISGNYFRKERVSRSEVEMRGKRLKKG